MIVFLTTAPFRNALQSLTGPGFGTDLPEITIKSYEDVLHCTALPRATYVFSDLERLCGAELRMVASLYQVIAATGVRVLNDPARVKLRYGLLRDLAARGSNPFNVYRGDDHPRPNRFPVFMRLEDGHLPPQTKLMQTQAELDAALEQLSLMGEPLKGTLVVECVPSDRVEHRWHKWGAFCIGGEAVLDHIAVDDNWMVKLGRWEQLTPGIVELEHRAVMENRHADYVRAMFKAAAIDFGRADFAISGRKPILFEINTNPAIRDLVADPHRLRQDTQRKARQYFSAALFKLDTPGGEDIRISSTHLLEQCRKKQPSLMLGPRF